MGCSAIEEEEEEELYMFQMFQKHMKFERIQF
jgi:hypothetical protein